MGFRYTGWEARVRRADGAKAWAEVLSELARVAVTVEWERPAWRVRWRDGPTRRVLMDRAAALGRFRVGSRLQFEQLRFTRSDSAVALALAWLAHASPAGAVSAVEAFCDDTGYPQTRFDEATLGAARLLARLGNGDGDVQQMGTLLAQAIPPVPAQHITIQAGPDLPGRVTSRRWPTGGPPDDLLGPSPTTPPAGPDQPPAVCRHCGRPLPAKRRGRPAKYCGGACRTAAHRAHHRPPAAPPENPRAA